MLSEEDKREYEEWVKKEELLQDGRDSFNHDRLLHIINLTDDECAQAWAQFNCHKWPDVIPEKHKPFWWGKRKEDVEPEGIPDGPAHAYEYAADYAQGWFQLLSGYLRTRAGKEKTDKAWSNRPEMLTPGDKAWQKPEKPEPPKPEQQECNCGHPEGAVLCYKRCPTCNQTIRTLDGFNCVKCDGWISRERWLAEREATGE